MASSAGGRRTVSITWMTPLLAATSAAATVASLIMTLPSTTLMAIGLPRTVSAEVSLAASAAMTLPATTW